jgi:hypothetical protein
VDYNGARIPWRLAADYIWFGTPEAKDLLDRLTGWADAQGISSVVDGYLVDGTPTGSWTRSNPWTGGWAAGAMSGTQTRLDAFSAWFESCAQDDDYYSTSLRALYMLMLSGNFWQPGAEPSNVGAGGSGGATATGGAAGAAGAVGAGAATASAGCDCRQARSTHAPRSAAAWLALALAAVRRRERRRAR